MNAPLLGRVRIQPGVDLLGEEGREHLLVSRRPVASDGLHESQKPGVALDMALLAKEMGERIPSPADLVELGGYRPQLALCSDVVEVHRQNPQELLHLLEHRPDIAAEQPGHIALEQVGVGHEHATQLQMDDEGSQQSPSEQRVHFDDAEEGAQVGEMVGVDPQPPILGIALEVRIGEVQGEQVVEEQLRPGGFTRSQHSLADGGNQVEDRTVDRVRSADPEYPVEVVGQLPVVGAGDHLPAIASDLSNGRFVDHPGQRMSQHTAQPDGAVHETLAALGSGGDQRVGRLQKGAGKAGVIGKIRHTFLHLATGQPRAKLDQGLSGYQSDRFGDGIGGTKLVEPAERVVAADPGAVDTIQRGSESGLHLG